MCLLMLSQFARHQHRLLSDCVVLILHLRMVLSLLTLPIRWLSLHDASSMSTRTRSLLWQTNSNPFHRLDRFYFMFASLKVLEKSHVPG